MAWRARLCYGAPLAVVGATTKVGYNTQCVSHISLAISSFLALPKRGMRSRSVLMSIIYELTFDVLRRRNCGGRDSRLVSSGRSLRSLSLPCLPRAVRHSLTYLSHFFTLMQTLSARTLFAGWFARANEHELSSVPAARALDSLSRAFEWVKGLPLER